MRIAIAGFMHESNTFSQTRTDRAAFEAASFTSGLALIAEWKDAHHEIGGFIEGASRFGYDIDPIVMAWATPAGPVVHTVLDEIAHQIIEKVRPSTKGIPTSSTPKSQHGSPGHDGLLIALHGAMVAEGFPDADGEVLRRLREAFGPDFPIVATLDFHANVSQQMAQHSTAIVMYQTNPHVDQRQRGLVAASIMARTVRREVRPTQVLAKPDTLITIACQNTSLEPLRPFVEEARSLEQLPGILAANISAGFPYADVHEMGPSVLIVTDNDQRRARLEADRLAAKLFASRRTLVRQLPDAQAAVARAMQSDKYPVVLVEFGDNIGGGSPGDSTVLLAELLRQRAGSVVVAIYDPESVGQAAAAGIGNSLELMVGGKTDRQHGAPVPVRAQVVALHDGRWVEVQPRHGGRRQNDQGQTAVIQIERAELPIGQSAAAESTQSVDCDSLHDFLVVLNSKRTPPFSLGQLTSVGIDPSRKRIIVVKAAIAYRAAYGPIAGAIIEVDTPGLTANDPRHFEYHRVRRPLFPLDDI